MASRTMFQNIHTVNISDSQMQMSMSMQHEEELLWGILHNQCTLTAQFDSKERYNTPKCAESTREAILKQLKDWANDDSKASKLFWLHGGAGAGKSALAQSLAEQLKDSILAASFFFFRLEASRNNGDMLVPTLVQQLVTSFPEIERFVLEQLRRNQGIFSKSREQQMKVLFIDPLVNLCTEPNAPEESKTHPRLIIIDGLDECKDQDVQCDILQVIAKAIPDLPYPFRFFVTSRPEGHLVRTFDNNAAIKKVSVTRYDLSKDSDANRDIHTFLNQEFKELRSGHPVAKYLPDWPKEEDVTALVDRSSGHFVYPATVIRYIGSSKHRPDDRLGIVLGLSPGRGDNRDQPFAQLDALYTHILSDIQKDDFISIKRAFGVLYLISEKIGYFGIYRQGSSRIIQDMLKLRPGDLDLLFDPLRSLVAQEPEEENLHVYHKTLFDFLLDKERSGQFHLERILCHESAALYILNTDILTNWSYAPDYMYFAYHCYLAQPLEDYGLTKFLKDLPILYDSRNQKGLLSMFTESGEQPPGAKTIFYVLRMLSMLDDDLHKIHSNKIKAYYVNFTPPQVQPNGYVNGSDSAFLDGQKSPHAKLNETINEIVSKWQLPQPISTVFNNSMATDARDAIIVREHEVFAAFAKAQHLDNSDYNLLSAFVPGEIVAHSYHYFSVEYEKDPSLVIIVSTYSKRSASAVCSAQNFDIALLPEKDFDTRVLTFLETHFTKVGKEFPQAIDDQFESKFEF